MRIKIFELKDTENQNIKVGGNRPEVLQVHEQDGKLMMWIQLDENYPGSFNLDIDIVKTGSSFETQGKYVNSVFMSSGMECHIYSKANYIRADELATDARRD